MTEKEKRLKKLKENPSFYIQNLLKIKTKKRDIKSLRFNIVQKKVYATIKKLRDAGKAVRVIILKARQTGISTLIGSLIFQDTATHRNVSSLIIAHDKESTAHLFKMPKLFYDRMDDNFRPMRKTSNRIEVLFENPSAIKNDEDPGLNSLIRVDTANNMQAGRAFTLQNLHCSELAFWEKPEEVMTGLLQSVPSIPESMVIIESTANGAGGYFYHMWKDAKAGANDFVPIFIPWFEDPEYRKELPPNFKLIDTNHPIYGNEAKLKERYNLDDEQIYWRRWYIKNYCNNEPLKFKQEYPATPAEAFIASGSNVFDVDIIEGLRKYTKIPQRGEFSEDDKGSIEFVDKVNGRWFIWGKPEEDNRYVFGCDVAEGLADGNYSCIEVLDKKNMEQVAEFHGHLRPEVFATEIAKGGKYYNNALASVEANNHGHTTLAHLRKIYFRIYYQIEFDKQVNKRTRNIGWRTTRKSKPLMIDKLDKSIRNKEIILWGDATLDELAEYVEFVNPDKNTSYVKMGAAGQGLDDRVIALAIANITWDSLPLKINETRKERDISKLNPYTGY